MRIITPYWTNRSLTSDLFDEMDKFAEDFNSWAVRGIYDERTFMPSSEVSETEDHYLMSLDVPGMKKEEIKIELSNNILTVSGERKRETVADKKEKFQRYEKHYGFFKRSFNVPQLADSSQIEARYENGVLELYLPKLSEAKPRQIEIKSGKTGFIEKLLGSKNDNSTEEEKVNKDKS